MGNRNAFNCSTCMHIKYILYIYIIIIYTMAAPLEYTMPTRCGCRCVVCLLLNERRWQIMEMITECCCQNQYDVWCDADAMHVCGARMSSLHIHIYSTSIYILARRTCILMHPKPYGKGRCGPCQRHTPFSMALCHRWSRKAASLRSAFG